MLTLLLPPSSAIRASCLVRPQRSEKDAFREETSDQKQLWAKTSFSGRRSGDVTLERRRSSKTRLSMLIRCQSTTKEQPTGWGDCCSPCSHVQWIGFSFSSRDGPWDIFLTLSMHRFSLRVWVFVATLPTSKQNVLARGEKKISLKTLMQHFLFRDSTVESLFCCREPAKEMFLVERYFSV